MALMMTCEKGHHYVQADIYVGDWPADVPKCPACAQERLINHQTKDVQRLCVNPGDVVVVFSDHPLSGIVREKIVDQMTGLFPDNTVIVMDRGLRLAVIEGSG